MEKKHAIALLISVSLFVTLVSIMVLIAEYRSLRHQGIRPAIHPPRHITPTDIRPWMTFAYINDQFRIPVSYLQETIGIHDPRYPNISLEDAATGQGVSPSAMVVEVQNALSHSQLFIGQLEL